MKSETKSMTGGLCMLAALVALLVLPMAFGYYTMKAELKNTIHADASEAKLTN